MTRFHSRHVRRSLVASLLLLGAGQLGCSTTGNQWKLPSWSWNAPKNGPTSAASAQSEHASLPVSSRSSPRSTSPGTDPDAEAPGLATMIANGRLQEKAGEWEKARHTYESAIKRFPNESAPYHRLGVVADQQRRYLEAEQMFTEAIRRNPRDAELFNDLGYCFFLQGQLDRAEAALLKATQLEPKNARFENNYGMVMAHQGRIEEALARFRTAGSEADAQYNLAFVFASQEKVDQAKLCFRRALAADPQHEAARRALQSFELYEQLPEDQRETEIAKNGERWVPYREPGEPGFTGPNPPQNAANGGAGNYPVQQASHASNFGPQRAAGAAAKTQFLESRSSLNQSMSGQRQGNRTQ